MRKQIEVALCDFPVSAGKTCGKQREQMSAVRLTRTDESVMEIDLCPDHWQALMANARPAGRRPRQVTAVPEQARRRLQVARTESEPDRRTESATRLAPVRAWAASHGVTLPSRGVIAAEIVEMFERQAPAAELKAWAAAREEARHRKSRTRVMREWARANGHEVEPTGALPAHVIASYAEAQRQDGEAKPVAAPAPKFSSVS